eukprot:12360815-Ditylum_brightwellii.AAC.1
MANRIPLPVQLLSTLVDTGDQEAGKGCNPSPQQGGCGPGSTRFYDRVWNYAGPPGRAGCKGGGKGHHPIMCK